MVAIPITDIYLGLMAFVRIGAMMFVVPVFASQLVPLQFRTALAVIFSILLIPGMYTAFEVPQSLPGLVVAMMGEALLGLLMGIAGRMLFFAVEFAVHILAQESSLMRSSTFDPSNDQETPTVGPLYFYLATILMFVTGTHLEMLGAFVKSFYYVPAGSWHLQVQSMELLARASSEIFVLGLRMAAPLVAMAFTLNLLFAILGRVSPKINVLILSFSFRIILGLLLMSMTVWLFVQYATMELAETPERMLRFLVEVTFRR